jgi:RNA polymerase sigma-70 factor (ECF subfamily)
MDGVARQRDSDVLPLNSFRRLLDEVWGENEERLLKLAIGLGLPGDQAADVLQDVYLMAIHKPPATVDRGELRRWLFRVTANRCHLEHRHRSRWRRLWSSLEKVWTTSHGSGSSPVCGELKQDVNRALATLTEDDRKLVVMRYFSELNSREIADIVGMPETTVRGRLRAVRRKLADELEDWNDGD